MRIFKLTFIASFVLSILFIDLANAQENYEVSEIIYLGNKTLSSSDLSEKIAMYDRSWIEKYISRKDPFLFSEEILLSDIECIIRCYQREGFLFVKAEKSKLDLNRKDREVSVTLKITEGKPVKINKIKFNFSDQSGSNNGKHSRLLNDLKTSFALIEDSRFRDEALQLDLEKITHSFSDAGYPYVEIDPQLVVKEQENTVDITWKINSGPKCTFGEVDINGNEFVSFSTIKKQLAFKNGDQYKQKSLDQSQQQIFALGMFHIATVKAILNKEESNVIPVKIQIKEAPRYSTKFGIGYSEEDKIRVFSESQYLGFLGQARRAILYLKHSGLEPYHIYLKLTQQAFLTPKTSIVLNPFLRRQEEPAYIVGRFGGSVSLIHPFTKYLNGAITYTYERVDLETNSIATQQTKPVQDIGLYNKSSITLGMSRDSSDPMFSPTGGLFSALSFKLGGMDLGSDFHYTKLILDLRKYNKFFGMVLAYRVKIGGIKSNDQHEFIPVEDRFYSGGSMSVRGWSRARLGPISTDNKPIGGKSLLESSIELRYPIYRDLSGVVFSDFGNVWLNSYKYDINDLRYSAGLGIRYATPIGPVRLDVARPVNDDDDHFQFHISIGQAF